jgi:hypothetical protein
MVKSIERGAIHTEVFGPIMMAALLSMPRRLPMQRKFAGMLLVLFIAGCAPVKTAPLPDDPVAQFPKMKAGDTFFIALGQGDKGRWTVESVDADGGFRMTERRDLETSGTRIAVDKNYQITILDNKNERLTNADTSPLRYLKIEFPLFPGKKWASSFKAYDALGKGPFDIMIDYTAAGLETIETAAGTVRAFRIKYILSGEGWNPYMVSPDKRGEIWFSPDVKMFVKIRHDWKPGIGLIAYSVTGEDGAVRSVNMPEGVAAATSPVLLPAASAALVASRPASDPDNIESNIPRARQQNPDAIAVIIGNRDYLRSRKVDFALKDAELMKRYVLSTLGYKEGNVFYLTNASKTDFELYFGNRENHRGKLYNAIKEGRSDVFIYYSGHGAPGLKDRKGYFVPVEADPQYLELSGYPLDVLYENLAKLPARSITVALDACFSGSTLYENISPLVLEVQNPVIRAKNMVVLASAGGTQVSSWYNEKNHSMFTYFLLRAMKDHAADSNKDGNLTFDELYSYVADKSEGVPYYARRINGVEQNPAISGQYQGKVFLAY